MLEQYLKKYRLEHNLSQEKMAEQLGTSQGYYSMIETGIRRPGYKIVNKIARLFQVDPSFVRKLM